MKQPKLPVAIAVFAASLAAAVTLTTGSAAAATRTWDGGGSDDKLSTAENWTGDTAPGNGDSIVLPYNVIFSGCSDSTPDLALDNDLDAGTVTLAGITATGVRPDGCAATISITGNTIVTSGNILGNDQEATYPRLVVGVPITASGNLAVASVRSTSSLAIGGNSVEVKSSAFDGGVSGSGTLTISGFIGGGSGGGGCSATATPQPFAGDSSSFSGGIQIIDGGYVSITARTNDMTRSASGVSLNGGSLGILADNGQNLTYDKPITLADGSLAGYQLTDDDCNSPTANTKATLSGTVTASAAIEVSLNRLDIHFAGTVTNKENLQLAEGQSGSLTFADGSTVTSKQKVITVSDQANCNDVDLYSANVKNIVNVDCSANIGSNAEFPAEVFGTLAGTGRVGHVLVKSGGRVAPGQSPGTLTVSSITWEEGGTYEFEIGKDAADKIVVNGAVALGNGTLEVSRYQDYRPKTGASYVIIDNDGTDAVQGTFKNLAEGATFTAADKAVYKVSYVGGSGNDVVLTVVSVPAAPDTGFALLLNNPAIVLAGTASAALGLYMLSRQAAFRKIRR